MPAEMILLANWIAQNTGIVYDQNNLFMLQKRVDNFLESETLSDIKALMDALNQNDSEFKQKFINLVVNNETYFFREPKFFYDLVHVLIPYFMFNFKGQKIYLWSMACSNGQEPYSMVMALEQAKKIYGNFDYEVLATDISTAALSKARQGIYTELEINRGLAPDQIRNNFSKLADGQFQINSSLISKINFQHKNLLENWGVMNKVDVILCRNVLYYFSQSDKEKIIGKIKNIINQDGIMVLSGTETIKSTSEHFNTFRTMIEYACYSLKTSEKTTPIAMQDVSIPKIGAA